MISFTIPGAPVPKQRPRVGKGRHVYTPERTRTYERTIQWTAVSEARKQKWSCTSEQVEVELRFYRAALRGDLDNMVKSATDAINGVLFVDDRQIIHIDAAMFLDRERPRTEVTVRLAAERSA